MATVMISGRSAIGISPFRTGAAEVGPECETAGAAF